MQSRDMLPPIPSSAKRERMLQRAIKVGLLSPSDADLVRAFILWKISGSGIADTTQRKLVHTLKTFRQYLNCDFADITPESWQAAVVDIRVDDTHTDWSKVDLIRNCRTFLFWGITENKIPHLSIDHVKRVKIPKAPAVTKTPEELPTLDDINKLLQYPSCTFQQQAMLAIAFWSGMRIGEILRLNWSDIIFGNQSITLRVKDTKGKQLRGVICVEALPYVATWRRHYPAEAGLPEGENPVFINRRRKYDPYHRSKYVTTWAWITRLEDAAGTKHFSWHACRAANITNSTMAGVPDSVIKDQHWGNQNTQMLQTYTLLTDGMKERAMLKRAGIKVEEEEKVMTGPQNCPSCCALNGPGDQYCRLCGYPLSAKASSRQRMINEAIAYVQSHYTVDEQIESMSSSLGISKEQVKKLLTGGI